MLRIERLLARASLDDPAAALDWAGIEASKGDDSWQQWLDEYDRGEAVVVRLDVTLEVHDGRRRAIEMSNLGVFIEVHADPPRVEQQIADIVSKDFETLTRKLSSLGHPIDADELSEMYVHVQLADDLQKALSTARARGRARLLGHPHADIRLSRAQGPN